jgi:hypothetical protein
MIKADLSVGFEVGSNVYDQYVPRKTYQIPDGAITTDLYTHMYTLPLAINAHHYFHISKTVVPYVSKSF